ncbi:hypothetical protein [Sporichthya polymorpha]|uniref:hypothetical protein n=1 Tax=Sporichthya polymorpha TaxID=35751 RepID=UPI0003638403|nr:hypothetical protein [Sporichthya polymorpha]
MTSVRSRAGAAAAAVLLAVAPALGAAPAHAHGGDPTLVPIVREIAPALPAEIVVQARTTVSEQLIVANPTATPLLVLDPAGLPFLRIAGTGTHGNVNSPWFHRTLNPPGVTPRLPESAKPGAQAKWVRLSREGSWGWFEPRMHPFEPGREPATGADPELTTWQVGLRYGERHVRVEGALERRTVTGSFLAQPDPRSDGLTATVAPGSVPAILLVAPSERRVEIAGRDGKPFLRLRPNGAFVNTDSVSFRDNPDLLDAVGRRTGWVRVGEPGRVRWLEPRLQYSADRPPEVVERAARPAELGRWEVPLTVDGTAAPLTGTLTWIPANTAPSALGGDAGSSFPWLPVLVGGAVVLGAGGLVAVSRGRARRVAA